MRTPIFAGVMSFFLAIAGSTLAIAQDQAQSPTLSGSQPGESPSPPPGIRSQPENNRTLEIAPQTGIRPPEGGVKVIPGDKSYNPGENSASINRQYNPDETGSETGGERKLPYVGITVEYASKCFLGKEEHGLEVLEVDPNSPADRAGVHSRKPSGALIAGGVAGAILGPLSALLNPLIERGVEQKSGDLIIAVNDHRVRSELDLEDELAKLKPGDTMYITVLRPLPGGSHSEFRLAVKVGRPGEAVASAGSSPPARSGSDAEEYAY